MQTSTTLYSTNLYPGHADQGDPRGLVDHDLLGLGESGRLQDAPGELVDLEALQGRRLVADRALPRALLAVVLEVGLEVEALQVLAVVTPGGQGHPLEGQRAVEEHLRKTER